MMEPNDIAALAQRIHDVERWYLGARSTRETRNKFWAFVVGVVHHGHPVYNPTPDRRWHLKSGGGGRPQSDDVAVRMPDRHYWDFIGGVGADGYTFGASADHGPLPMEQPVFPPPMPEGGVISTPVQPSEFWTPAHAALHARLAGSSVQIIAEQFAYSFPGENWAMKRASASRPVSSNTIARKVPGGWLFGVQVVPTVFVHGRLPQDQVLEPTAAVNHLGDPVGPPPVEPPQTPVQPPAATVVDLAPVLEAIAALSLKVDRQRQEVLDAVKGQSYDIDASAGYLGRVRGTIKPQP